ncbi:GNAT family N-acetyltransferase [Georgenia alba]|uniref:GNAT family N-acetyltransferase n=1 Tax=Georgenia alba TaxID=2233858 RepID=A0ABW2Q7W0_9MICO
MSATSPQIRILEVPPPSSADAEPTPAIVGWSEIDAEASREVFGHDDFTETPAQYVARFADQRHSTKTLLVAVPEGVTGQPTEPGQVLGVAPFGLPTDDNLHLAQGGVSVRASARRQGIGTALWRAAEERIRAAGRTTVTEWTAHAAEVPDGVEVLEAKTGVGKIPATDAAARFALRHGFTLEQTERQSTLRLPVAPETVAAWRAEAQGVAGADYRVVQWENRTPEQWLEPMAELNRRMSTDVPMGGLEFEEEAWDAQRVRDLDERAAARGYRYVLSAAEHVPSGTLVAYTQLDVSKHKPEVSYQETTIVHGEHRGKRLGLLVKSANIELLAATHPAVRRIHTWNAGENEHMLAINIRMGFELAAVEGAWQAKLGAPATAESTPAESTAV